MKKLIQKLLLFALPFAVIFVCFFVFETNDYFALKDNAIYASKPLSAMRRVRLTEPENIILGDSRMANLNVGYIEEITGVPYTMMAFGGASLGENVALFWYATEHTALKKVVWGINFYTAFGGQGPGRVPSVQKEADNVFSFTGDITNWLVAISNGKRLVFNQYYRMTDQPGRMVFHEDPTQFGPLTVPPEMGALYRKDLEEYAHIIYTNSVGLKLEQDTLDQLDAIIDYCAANDIELIFVFPFMHESIRTYVVDPMALNEQNEAFHQYVMERATVYDLEFLSPFNRNADNFFDGFHLMSEQKKYLAQLLFNGLESEDIHRYPHENG